MKESSDLDKQLTSQTEQVLLRSIFMMATEIPLPINSIIGWSEITLKSEENFGSLTEAQKQNLSFIHQAGKRAKKQLEFLFDISRLVFGRLHLDIEEINLHQLIEESISATWVKVQQNIPDYLPKIWVDQMRVQQTLEWALQEAIHAIYPGEERIEILTVSCDDSFVTFNVTAHGSGSLRYSYDLNDPEFYYSRSIIELHGGQMQVNVQEELEKLEIFFTLPIKQNKPADKEMI